MAIRTRPIRDVIVERQIADEAAAFDLANTIGEVVEESQSELMTKADGRALLAEVREMFASLSSQMTQLEAKVTQLEAKVTNLDAKVTNLEEKFDARITETDAKSAKRDAESNAENAERQAQTYRFILFVGAASTTIISLVVAFT